MSRDEGFTTFDLRKANESLGGDQETLVELAKLFIDTCPEMLASIQSAIADRNATELHHSAHRLKSSVANFFASATHRTAAELEKMGRDNLWEGVEGNLHTLQTHLDALIKELRCLSGRSN